MSDSEYLLIALLAVENLLGLSALIAYVAYRQRQRPKVIHMEDEETDGLKQLLGEGDEGGDTKVSPLPPAAKPLR